ncbi:MAG: hypothetical protein ABL973_04605 [Micropepsaceae bacterium]
MLTLLNCRYNGHNNPGVSMSIREAAREIGCARNTASAAIADLKRCGFIVEEKKGHFQIKDRHASTWHLTWLPTKSPAGDMIDPDKRFMRLTMEHAAKEGN